MKAWRWTAAVSVVLLLAAALYLGPAVAARRQPASLDEQVRIVASELRCLQCQGLSAWESNTESSLQMRAEIRQLLEQGLTRREIVEHYVERYGSWVLITPPLKGFGLWAYLVPAGGVLLGAGVIGRLLRRRVELEPAGGRGAPASNPGGQGASLVDEALRRYEGREG